MGSLGVAAVVVVDSGLGFVRLVSSTRLAFEVLPASSVLPAFVARLASVVSLASLIQLAFSTRLVSLVLPAFLVQLVSSVQPAFPGLPVSSVSWLVSVVRLVEFLVASLIEPASLLPVSTHS